MSSTKSNKLGYINAVRGLAILLVIVLHVSSAVKGLPEIFTYMCGKGAFGVQLFFVASAFTLFLSYTSRLKKEGKDTNRNFFIRRFFRISPMYYLAALVYSAICYFIPAYNDGQPLVPWKVAANIVYLNGFLPGAVNYLPPGGWSVGVEMVFYCCVPFLFMRVKNLKAATTWFIVLALAAVLLKLLIRLVLVHYSIDYHRPENWFLYFWFPNQAPVFMLGIVLFFALQKYHVKSRVQCYTGILITTLLLLVFMYFRRDIDPYNIIPEHTIVPVFFAVNIFLLAQHPVILLDNKITRFFGEISFSLYLVHFIVIYVLEDYCPLPANPFAQFITLLVLTLIIAGSISKLTYHCIELKGIEWGNGIIKRRAVKTELEPGI
jgi:peptidoglycan/LPS O-acetylase OafA/YrhL